MLAVGLDQLDVDGRGRLPRCRIAALSRENRTRAVIWRDRSVALGAPAGFLGRMAGRSSGYLRLDNPAELPAISVPPSSWCGFGADPRDGRVADTVLLRDRPQALAGGAV